MEKTNLMIGLIKYKFIWMEIKIYLAKKGFAKDHP